MAIFLITFVLTTVIFAILLGGFLIRVSRGSGIPAGEVFLYSLGLAPGILTLFLYYLLLLLPRYGGGFFVGCVLAGFFIVGYLGRRGWVGVSSEWRKSLRDRVPHAKSLRSKSRHKLVLYFAIPLLLLAIFFGVVFGYVIQQPIKDHDVVQYAVMGRILAEDQAIDFGGYRPHESTGFYSQIVHPPAFSLLHTWEIFLNLIWDRQGDFFFRSISSYYALLILIVLFYWLRKISDSLAWLGMLVAMSGLAFFLAFITYHIDSFRMFFVCVSWIFLARSIEGKNWYCYILLGIFSGLAAFTHSIGLVVAALNCLAIFLFLAAPFAKRLVVSGSVSLLVMLFGGIHYVIDFFWGRGSIF